MVRSKYLAAQLSVKSISTNKEKPLAKESYDHLVPTGSTLLNLALSEDVSGGFPLGSMSNLVGGRSAGKSILALSCCAEMTQYEEFDNCRLIYDDIEQANSFDMEYLFGEEMVNRLEAPRYDKDREPEYSATIQDLQDNLIAAMEKGEQFFYIVDSLDGLSSTEELDKAQDEKKARESGKKTTGSYGMYNAKYLKRILRMTAKGLRKTNSGLLVLSQVIDNTDMMSFKKHKRAGGNALGHYAVCEVWMHSKKKIPKTHKGVTLNIGTETVAKVERTKITGKVREAQFSIYYDYGIDDLGSMVDWMVKNKIWEKKGNTINSGSLGITAGRDKLIREIEKNDLEDDLKEAVEKAWVGIEENLKLKRKRKY